MSIYKADERICRQPRRRLLIMSTAASHELLLASGNAPAVVRVNNITSTIQGPSDAWGRTNRPQPISISATVCMEKPFGSTSTTDTLASDTVHYGLLSKAILSSLAQINASVDPDHPRTLSDVLGRIYSDLTGTDILDSGREPGSEPPFLNLNSIRSLEVTVLLPKATLQGSGVSLTATGIFAGSKLAVRGAALKLHDLRIPVLLGVNENERTAKQSIVANLAVERFAFTKSDGYCGLEEVLVQVRPLTNPMSIFVVVFF